jgi:hypothetical protein
VTGIRGFVNLQSIGAMLRANGSIGPGLTANGFFAILTVHGIIPSTRLESYLNARENG